MTDVDTLFEEFRQAHRSGGDSDPRRFLAQVEGTDRRELHALIDSYLDNAPGRSWDAEAFAGSPVARAVGSIVTEWDLEGEVEEAAVGWAQLLPALRNRAQILRRELVERLALDLGAADEVERVAAYYHQMEYESLPAAGVSNTVLSKLGEILGESAETLRAAGQVAGGKGTSDELAETAFARKGMPDERYSMPSPAPAASPGTEPDEGPDRVDELFTGGPDA